MTPTKTPIKSQRVLSNGVAWLKWLRTPRSTCKTMTTASTVKPTAVRMPAQRTHRLGFKSDNIQIKLAA
jgi:hypothetical protein